MAQVDSENITAMPVVSTRRRFLSQAAAATAGGAALGVTLPLTGSAAHAVSAPDPILEAIAAHRAAYANWSRCVLSREELSEELPDDKCRTVLLSPEDRVVETDDPRWIEAELEYVRTAKIEHEASWQLLNTPLATTSAILALVDYALAHDTDGEQWQDDWHRGLLECVAEALADLHGEGAAA